MILLKTVYSGRFVGPNQLEIEVARLKKGKFLCME